MSKKKKIEKHHVHFSGSLLILAGISVYTFFSLFNSTNKDIDRLQNSVLHANEEKEVQTEPVVVKNEDLLNPFVDLPSGHPHQEAVLSLYYDGVLKGDGFGNFRPDNKVNRAEFTKILIESAKVDFASISSLENCFEDVTSIKEQWFAAHVCSAKEKNFVKGVEGRFYPEREITSAEALKIVLTVFGYQIEENPSREWYENVFAVAFDQGITKTHYTDPLQSVSRGQVAQMIFNAQKR